MALDPLNKTQGRRPKEQRDTPAANAAAPAGLLTLIDGWNGLGDSIVKSGNGARRDPPAKEILQGWRKTQREPELREAFSDIPKLLGAIRRAAYCHRQDWFSLAWLFGKNKDGQWKAAKLLNGGYDNNGSNGKRPAMHGDGFNHGAAPVINNF